MNEINKNQISNSDNKIKLCTLNNGSNSNLNLYSTYSRKDTYGNLISKKAKHKICFADKVEGSKKFIEIKTVNSYKEYNQFKPDEAWSCIIF